MIESIDCSIEFQEVFVEDEQVVSAPRILKLNGNSEIRLHDLWARMSLV